MFESFLKSRDNLCSSPKLQESPDEGEDEGKDGDDTLNLNQHEEEKLLLLFLL